MAQRPLRRDVFRYSLFMRVAIVVIALFFLTGLFATRHAPHPVWAFHIFIGLSVLGIGAVIDVFLTRVELRDHDIYIVQLSRRRAYGRREIAHVSWEGGIVSLWMVGEWWVHLPDLGRPQRVAGAIRTWLNE
jgi:hypothetical protein